MEKKTSDMLPAALILISNDALDVDPITYLKDAKFTIGRSIESSLKLRQRRISRLHCTLDKVEPQKWTITAHNNVTVNGCPLPLNESRKLLCGDKIKLSDVVIFEYKCAPDQNQHCCRDFKDNISENKNIDRETEKLCLASTSSNFSSFLITEPIDVMEHESNDNNSNPFTVKISDLHSPHLQELKNASSSSNLSDVEKSLLKYTNDLKTHVFSEAILRPKLIDEFKFRLNVVKLLYDFIVCRKSETSSESNKITNAVHEAVEALFSFFKEKCEILNCSDKNSIPVDYNVKSNETALDLDVRLLKIMKSMFAVFNEVSDDAFSTQHCKCATDTAIVKEQLCENLVNEKNKNVIHSKELQQAKTKIEFLEWKLKEKDKVEMELELRKEEVYSLENKITGLKRALAGMEIMELELKVLKETTKYKEDDKRSKDALEDTISCLKHDNATLKDKNEKLTCSASILEGENFSLKQKCEELEQKLQAKTTNETKTSSGCGGDGYCCDMVREVKSSLVDLLETEFNCSICGDMFINATVTNCNHVFCFHCLKEWKKKKKQCPFCRTNLNKECKVPVVDEFITNLSKLISEKIYNERMQMIKERENAGTPPAKRARKRAAPRGEEAAGVTLVPNLRLQNIYPYPYVPGMQEQNPSIVIL